MNEEIASHSHEPENLDSKPKLGVNRRRFILGAFSAAATLTGLSILDGKPKAAHAQAIGVSTDGGKNPPMIGNEYVPSELPNLSETSLTRTEIDPNQPASLSSYLDYLNVAPEVRAQYFKEMEQFCVGTVTPGDKLSSVLRSSPRFATAMSLPDGDIYYLACSLNGNFDVLETNRSSNQRTIEFQKININYIPGVNSYITNKELEKIYGPAEDVVIEEDKSTAVLYSTKGLVARYSFHLPPNPDPGVRVIEDLEFFSPTSVDDYKNTWGTQNYKNFGK